jgi:hypothetical protein
MDTRTREWLGTMLSQPDALLYASVLGDTDEEPQTLTVLVEAVLDCKNVPQKQELESALAKLFVTHNLLHPGATIPSAAKLSTWAVSLRDVYKVHMDMSGDRKDTGVTEQVRLLVSMLCVHNPSLRVVTVASSLNAGQVTRLHRSAECSISRGGHKVPPC